MSMDEHREDAPSSCVTPEYPVVATTQLRLRGFALRDISRLIAAEARRLSDTAVGVQGVSGGFAARKWIVSHAAEWSNRRAIHWAVTLLSDDQLIGYIGLSNIDVENRRARLGFWLDRRIRSERTIEAAQGAMAFAFNDLDMDRVYVYQNVTDRLAPRILRALGMRDEGQLSQDLSGLEHVDAVRLWSLLKAQWLEDLSE